MKQKLINNEDNEYLCVCDEAGNPLYTAARKVIHTKGLRHRVIHLWFVDEMYLYFQQRSADKEAFPLGYDITCAGHIDLKESAQDACIRECEEELGITLTEQQLQPIGTYYEEMMLSKGIDREFADVFLCRFPLISCKLNNEVLTVGKIKLDDIVKMLQHMQTGCDFYDLLKPQVCRLSASDIFLHEPAYYQWLLKAILA